MLCFEFEYLLPIIPYGHVISSRTGGVGKNCFLVGDKIFSKQRLSVLFSQFAYEQDDNNTGRGPCVIRLFHFQFRIKIQFRPSTFDLSICLVLVYFGNKTKIL